MLGYIFLSVSLLAGGAKGYFGKKTGGLIRGYKDSILANILRMLLCTAIGFLVVLIGGNVSRLAVTPELLLISALSGVSTSVFVVTWLVSVKKSAYMMLDVFLMLGVLVPILLGKALFEESVTLLQWCGIAVLILSAIIMCSYNNSIKEKLTVPSVLTLLLCGTANGVTDFSQKLFVKRFAEVPIAIFNVYTYIFSSATLLLCYLILSPKQENVQKPVFRKLFGYIGLMAVCLFAASYFKTAAAQYLDSALLYPLSQGAGLILSSAMSAVLFREKLTAKCLIGLAIAFIGLLMINVL